MLECYHMQDSKPMDTFVDMNLSLSRDMCPNTLEKKCLEYLMPMLSVV